MRSQILRHRTGASPPFYVCFERKGISFKCKFSIVASVTWIKIASSFSSSPKRVKTSSHAHTSTRLFAIEWISFICSCCTMYSWGTSWMVFPENDVSFHFFCWLAFLYRKDENILGRLRTENREMKLVHFTACRFTLTLYCLLCMMQKPDL